MATANANGNGHVGKVVQIIGPVVDVEFGDEYLPPIYQALRITSDGFDVPDPIDVIAEVQQHLGEGRVRAVSMLPTDGMVRWIIWAPFRTSNATRFIVTHLRSTNNRLNYRCSKRESKSSI